MEPDKTIKLWDAADGRCGGSTSANGLSPAFFRRCLTCCSVAPGVLFRCLRTIDGFEDSVSGVHFLGEGRGNQLLTSCLDGYIRIFDL